MRGRAVVPAGVHDDGSGGDPADRAERGPHPRPRRAARHHRQHGPVADLQHLRGRARVGAQPGGPAHDGGDRPRRRRRGGGDLPQRHPARVAARVLRARLVRHHHVRPGPPDPGHHDPLAEQRLGVGVEREGASLGQRHGRQPGADPDRRGERGGVDGARRGRRVPEAGDGHADPGAAAGQHRRAGVRGRGRPDEGDEQGQQGGDASHPASVTPSGAPRPGIRPLRRPAGRRSPVAGIMEP